MSRPKAVIVGGGIAGIAGALLLSRSGFDVTLIEHQPRLGGLLGTWQSDWGCSYDFGTHFVAETGLAEMDDILVSSLDKEDWHQIPLLKPGTFFEGRCNCDSSSLDLRGLPAESYQKVVAELVRKDRHAGSFDDLEAQLLNEYGAETCRHVFAPVLGKFFGVPLAALAPNSHILFGLKRFIALTANEARELKKDAWIDGRLAFHTSQEGASSLKCFYPRTGGMSRWIEVLHSRLAGAKVNIVTGKRIAAVLHQDRVVDSVVLEDGSHYSSDLLVWTIAPDLLLQYGDGLAPEPNTLLPHSTLTLFHLLVDQPPLVEAYYVTCYDPKMATFRVTFYTNVQGRTEGAPGWHLTVEALRPGPNDVPLETTAILKELKTMQLIPVSSRILHEKQMQMSGGFPVLSQDFVARRESLIRQVNESFRNVALAGKGSGRAFFTVDVVRNAHATLSTFASS